MKISRLFRRRKYLSSQNRKIDLTSGGGIKPPTHDLTPDGQKPSPGLVIANEKLLSKDPVVEPETVQDAFQAFRKNRETT